MKTVLRRLGNKSKLLDSLLPLLPIHTTYIEAFFGTGSVYFEKPLAKYNILNDLDSDVFNLFMVIKNKKTKKQLEKAFYEMPIHKDLLSYWKKNQETDPIQKACRFLLLSNFTFMGGGDTLRLENQNIKQIFYKSLGRTHELLTNASFSNTDASKFINSISYKDPKSYFCYCDPPYLDTVDNYSNSYTEALSRELIETLLSKGINFGMSEFDNPIILALAEEYGLEVHYLGERKNIGNRRVEVYVCNYKTNQLKMF
jgi:DNA adenine methylase